MKIKRKYLRGGNMDNFYSQFDGRHLLIISALLAGFVKFVFKYFDLEKENKELKKRLGR